jgi:hypothetical protein
MATALTPHTCRDCGVTIPDGRGWFVWPGFPAAGSAPLGWCGSRTSRKRTRRRATSRPPARSRCATPACLSAAPTSVSSPTRTTRRSQATPRLPPPGTGSSRIRGGTPALRRRPGCHVVAEHPQRDVYLSVRGIPDRFADALIAAGAAQQIAVEVCRDPGCDAPRGHIDIYRLDTGSVVTQPGAGREATGGAEAVIVHLRAGRADRRERAGRLRDHAAGAEDATR